MKKLILVLILALLGCAEDKKPEVSFDTLETARNQARDNAKWNAQNFRQGDPRITGWDMVIRGDSTQSPECPQGDGWASVDFIKPDKAVTFKAKCSTVSAAVGCVADEEFKGKSYGQDDGHCQNVNKVPFPFRKIVE